MKDEKQKKSYIALDDQDDSQVHRTGLGDLKSFFTLFRYAQEYRLAFFSSLVLILLAACLSILSARLMGELVEKGLVARDFSMSFYYGAIIISAELLSLLLLWSGNRWLAFNSSKTIYSIREKLFKHLQNLPMTYFDHQPQGRIVTRLTHDVESLEEFFTGSLGRLSNSFFMVCLAITAMLLTHFFLGSLLILSMLPALIFIYLTRMKVRSIFRAISKFSSAVNAKLSEYLSGIDVIRSFGLENWSKTNYKSAIDRHLHANLRANTFFAWSRPLISLFCTFPLIGLVWFGGQLVLAGTLSVGIFVAFIRYYERFYMPVLNLAREIHVIQQAFTSAERVASFLSEKNEDFVFSSNDNTHLSDGTIEKGEIIFDDVWMNYSKLYQETEASSGDWVLKKLSFHIKAGEKVGLVGHTGCGKTTTVSLLSRLYDFQRGDIFIDGKSIRSFGLDYIRSQIGFVSQDAVIFKGTLRDNLLITLKDSFNDEFILKTCKKTGFINVMEQNQLDLDSLIEEDGSNLSSGEKQLLSFTRVLISDPKILILDEATANIDSSYEKIIHNLMDQVMVDRTCLIIAHRLDTLSICDKILVFSEGTIIEEGTEQELLLEKKVFHSLHQANI